MMRLAASVESSTSKPPGGPVTTPRARSSPLVRSTPLDYSRALGRTAHRVRLARRVRRQRPRVCKRRGTNSHHRSVIRRGRDFESLRWRARRWRSPTSRRTSTTRTSITSSPRADVSEAGWSATATEGTSRLDHGFAPNARLQTSFYTPANPFPAPRRTRSCPTDDRPPTPHVSPIFPQAGGLPQLRRRARRDDRAQLLQRHHQLQAGGDDQSATASAERGASPSGARAARRRPRG